MTFLYNVEELYYLTHNSARQLIGSRTCRQYITQYNTQFEGWSHKLNSIILWSIFLLNEDNYKGTGEFIYVGQEADIT